MKHTTFNRQTRTCDWKVVPIKNRKMFYFYGVTIVTISCNLKCKPQKRMALHAHAIIQSRYFQLLGISNGESKSVERYFGMQKFVLINLYFLHTVAGVQPVQGHLIPKMNITFLIIINWTLNISFIQQLFGKQEVLSEKTLKNCFGAHLTIFWGKGGTSLQN